MCLARVPTCARVCVHACARVRVCASARLCGRILLRVRVRLYDGDVIINPDRVGSLPEEEVEEDEDEVLPCLIEEN